MKQKYEASFKILDHYLEVCYFLATNCSINFTKIIYIKLSVLVV